MKKAFFGTILSLLVFSCQNESKKLIIEDTNTIDSTDSFNDPIFKELQEESKNYLLDRDIDEDGTPDHISFEYSQGAHCCYYMSIKLSTKKDTINYPFEMDGGYIFGVDGSWPEHFEINDFNCDGYDEIFMEIATYNGKKDPIPSEWTKEYGITTNTIIFDFIDGELVVVDFQGSQYGRFLCSSQN